MFTKTSLLRSLFFRANANPDAAAPVALVEALEPRLVPSATVATGDFDRNGLEDLKIKINDPGQHLVITEDDAAGTTTVAIDANNDNRFDGAGDFLQTFNTIFDGVKVKLRANGEQLDYVLASDMAAVQHDLNFKLNNTTGSVVNFDAQGFAVRNDVAADLRVGGGAGNNVVNVKLDAVANSGLGVGITLGGSSNAVNVSFFGDVTDNSLVRANVLVGPGANAGANVVNVAVLGNVDHAELDVRVDGSNDSAAGDDNVNFQLAGVVTHGALLDVSMHLGDGNDEGHVTVAQSTFGVLDNSAAFITVDGGARGDNLSVNSDGGAGIIPIDATSKLDIFLNGGSGNDGLTTDFSDVNAFRLDGELILLVSGGTGNDGISVGLANTTTSHGLYDVTLRGDQDNDTFKVFIDDPSGGLVNYDSSDLSYPTGFAIVAGGGGFNAADVFGNVALFNIQSRVG